MRAKIGTVAIPNDFGRFEVVCWEMPD